MSTTETVQVPACFTPFLRSVIRSALAEIDAGRVPPFLINQRKEGTVLVVIPGDTVPAERSRD